MVDRCPTCGRKHKRSIEANRRYWLLLHAIAEKLDVGGQKYSTETWHAYFKSRFLGAEEVKLPNGKTLQIPNSSADLDTAAFAEFMTKVEVWAGEHNVWLADLESAA